MKKTIILLTVFILIFASCSSAGKNQGDVFNIRSNAEVLLASGNSEAGKGKLENALLLINESKRNAILADSSSLIVRASLSRGNILLSLGRTDEAYAEWEFAFNEAQKTKNNELISACKIFLARGNLFSQRASAQAVYDDVSREAANIKSDRQYIALSWQVRGLALRALGSYREAENAINHSLAIQEKDMYLENASYDWYTIASIRSLSGNSTGAIEALENSIEIDRRIENSWGLAASWKAMGDVYTKAGNSRQAAQAYQRASSIYAAMGNDAEAAEIEKRIVN